jgi:hypothetical protein
MNYEIKTVIYIRYLLTELHIIILHTIPFSSDLAIASPKTRIFAVWCKNVHHKMQ